MKENKILVRDSNFLECVDELATQITEMNFGADTYTEKKIFETFFLFPSFNIFCRQNVSIL